MKSTSLPMRLTVVILGFALNCATYAFAPPMPESSPTRRLWQPALERQEQVASDGIWTVLRTLAYHEITRLKTSVLTGAVLPVLSKSGNRAAFATFYYGTPRGYHIHVVDFDGSTPPREVNSYEGESSTNLDISADGTKVVSCSQYKLFISKADGSLTTRLLEMEIGRIAAVRIAGSGTRIVMRIIENGARLFPLPQQEMKKGIWIINADGTNLRQVVGAEQVAPILGVPVANVPLFDTAEPGLDISDDGGRIVFGMFDNPQPGGVGQRLFSVDADGGNLRAVTDRQSQVQCAISGDGSRIGYYFQAGYIGQPNLMHEIGVVEGTTRKPLVTWKDGDPYPFPTQALYISDLLTMSTDGSQMLLGDSGVLLDTISGNKLQLAALHNFYSSDYTLVGDSLWHGVMSGRANRFVCVTRDSSGIDQLATVELNPAIVGAAPTIADPKAEPTFVLTAGRSAATVSARVSAPVSLKRVVSGAFRDGLNDRLVGQVVLLDDGTHGDVTAADGVFTSNQFQAATSQTGSAEGPRTIRVKAESLADDNTRHALAIDFDPFYVSSKAPLIEVTPTTLDFGNVKVGERGELSLAVRNIGAASLSVQSFSSTDGQFTTPAPTTPFKLDPGGQQAVTVRFVPASTGSKRAVLTITSTDPERSTVTISLQGNGVAQPAALLDHTMTDGPIPGACGKPAAKNAFAPTDAKGYQWTMVSGALVGDLVRWDWIAPNGSTYRQNQWALSYSDQVCFWDAIDIAGQQAASLPGTWQVRVYHRGSLLVSETFTIAGGGIACEVLQLWPVEGAAPGKSSTLWAQVKNTGSVSLPSNANVWFYVDGPNWTNNWIGSSTVAGLAPGASQWYSFDWSIPSSAAAGNYYYWAQVWTSSAISGWSSGQSFVVGQASRPGKAVLISPNGTISTGLPTYTWSAVPSATWYFLFVNDRTASSGKIREWYSAGEAGCVSGTGNCSITPSTAVTAGPVQWWILAWNSAGYGPWSDEMDFMAGAAQDHGSK